MKLRLHGLIVVGRLKRKKKKERGKKKQRQLKLLEMITAKEDE